jgi:flavoprotein
MPVIQGTTSGSVAGVAYNIPGKIISYRVCNKTGGAITVTVSIVDLGVGNIRNIGYHSLAANACDGVTADIFLPEGFTVYLAASGSCDYWFSIENI